ncbi:hypothetical protein ABEF95_016030 [Exophiala dermatitidis]
MAGSDLVTELQHYTSSDVADALVKLGVRYGGYLHGLKMFSPEQQAGTTKVVGPVFTVQMVDAADTTAPTPKQFFVDCVQPGEVVFISQPQGYYTACWGGLMSTRSKYLGARGVVIDGNFRDILEHRELGFPLFARATSPVGSAGMTRSSRINVPVQFTSPEQKRPFIIHPGDYVLADADGVVIIPVDHAPECLRLMAERAEIDRKTLEALHNGEPMGTTIARLRV